jgi:hypothetical protein
MKVIEPHIHGTSLAAKPLNNDASRESTYQPPRVVYLGKTREMIRGYWQQGTADAGYNWYITGE